MGKKLTNGISYQKINVVVSYVRNYVRNYSDRSCASSFPVKLKQQKAHQTNWNSGKKGQNPFI